MNSFEEFEQELREALTHLYDPIYQVSPLLRQVLAQWDRTRKGPVLAMVIAAIQSLKPGPEAPPNARSRRLYDLLDYRYVQELTQEETAERLGITPRHLRREQQQAVQMLAQSLWQAWGAEAPPAPVAPVGLPATGDAWRSQVREELAVLEQSDPGAVGEVGPIADQIVQLETGLAARHGCRLACATMEAELVVAVHSSILRQLLIVAVQKMIQAIGPGQVTICARRDGDAISIDVIGGPARDVLPVSEFVAETVAAHGGQAAVRQVGDQLLFSIMLPGAQLRTVLVVDDNADLVHLYRRNTERTRFRIEHVTEGRQIFDAVARLRPHVVLLDVMLPDMDGWEVLTRLHENPATRMIPVIICSVVRQEELALALGARRYLTKPVRRQELIQALEEATSPA
jgi:CheY-like chemotaxis protein